MEGKFEVQNLCVAQWVKCLTHNWSAVSSNPIKASGPFHEQETLPSLLSTGWFQEQCVLH